jgi:antirestriction protein ArdC
MKINELYKGVTATIVAQLEEGVPPWTRPWKDSKLKGVGMIPTNLITGRLYSGGNILLLWLTAHARGYDNLQFCTYNQVNGIGAKVKKGEKSTHVIFTKHVTRKDEESGDEKPGTIVKTYPVFHLSQLENVPDKYLELQQPEEDPVGDKRVKLFVGGTGVKVTFGSNKAAYYPVRDEIVMPTVGVFENQDAFTGTLYHELIHATGHKDRLNREFGKRFGDKAYSFEELVAELGSAFLCARFGIQPTFRSAAYIADWLKVLGADNRAVFSAASYAGHASEWLWKKVYAEERQEYKEAAE